MASLFFAGIGNGTIQGKYLKSQPVEGQLAQLSELHSVERPFSDRRCGGEGVHMDAIPLCIRSRRHMSRVDG